MIGIEVKCSHGISLEAKVMALTYKPGSIPGTFRFFLALRGPERHHGDPDGPHYHRVQES